MLLLFFIFTWLSLVFAQNISLELTTSSLTITLPVSPSAHLTTVVPDIFNVTHTLTSSTIPPTSSVTSTPSATTTSTPVIVLTTKVTPAFAVLGAILIITGIPSAFWGHKNRWTSFFLIGFYTLALVCAVLILKFGVLPAINPPSQTLRGMFVLSASIAGFAGGAIAIFFWKAARYGIGAWGGFAFALWIQSFHNGGVIRSMSFRWILYIGCAVLGFTLCTIPKIHYHVLLISTAFVGASSFILGVDCFTTAGLKEFYIWNIGFPTLFHKFTDNGIEFPVSQTMQIELGLIGAIALMGTAVQFRILKVLQKKLREIAEEMKKRDEEAELQATERFDHIAKERDAWEKEHPSLLKHGGHESSTLSSMPFMKDGEDSPSPVLGDSRPRHLSGISDFKVAPTSDEDLKRASRFVQTPGVLPALDLGQGIQEDVPSTFMAKSRPNRVAEALSADLEEFKRKEELLAEIQTIRRSIDVLKSETPVPSSSEPSRRPSFASRRTLSIDAGTVLLPTSHSRPPRAIDPRVRVHSMELSALAPNTSGDSIIRPTSVPLKESDWDNYIQERRLLQPPAGVTPPIATTTRMPLSPAVQDALTRRKRRESTLGLPPPSTDSSEDTPLAKVVQQKTNASPVVILPPRRSAGPIIAPIPQVLPNTRTRTFEELSERHREKLRDMQAPLTQAEKEHAELEAARQRWERSKALEKEAVTRRQAEKAAALEKRKKSGNSPIERPPLNEHRSNRHSRSLSADKLANFGTSSSRRLSTLKVEDWQRYQQDAEMGIKADQTSSKRDSRKKGEGVPFPDDGRGRRSKSRDF
ncbi:hypothetical protein BYT27DRAFT_7189790 [Phlegmacium glaucopus]|nr:hypothetical protein BYT27DRAFT_7189790 [Phlegmacium glaucopus]